MKVIQTKGKLNEVQLDEVMKTLQNGGLIIYPTDTAYGLGVLAGSKRGVNKLMEYKGARAGKAVSIAVSTRKIAGEYVVLNDVARKLYEKYLPGAVTVISRQWTVDSEKEKGKLKKEKGRRKSIDYRLVSENGTLGIRIPDSEIVRQITSGVGEGITSTSANVSGAKTPYSIDALLDSLPEEKKAMIDLVIDIGELPMRPTSTIVDTTTEPPVVLRGDPETVDI